MKNTDVVIVIFFRFRGKTQYFKEKKKHNKFVSERKKTSKKELEGKSLDISSVYCILRGQAGR